MLEWWRHLTAIVDENVNGIVVAPTCLYGRSGSYFAYYHFDAALAAMEKGQKEFETIVRDDSRLLTIHHDDLADLYVRVGERVSFGSHIAQSADLDST